MFKKPQKALRTSGEKRQQTKVLKMSKSGPLQYFRDVKAEAKKVTWPSRKETIQNPLHPKNTNVEFQTQGIGYATATSF